LAQKETSTVNGVLNNVPAKKVAASKMAIAQVYCFRQKKDGYFSFLGCLEDEKGLIKMNGHQKAIGNSYDK
jgi:hypothetical protein